MQTIFDKIIVTKAEYSIFKTLHESEKLRWLFDVYDATRMQIKGLDLSSFFAEVKDNLDHYKELPIATETEAANMDAMLEDQELDFVDVMIDDENIMIESNSLRALRHVTNKFMESGYMLRRDIATEKMFRKDKTTRYMRVFQIISYTNGMCLN